MNAIRYITYMYSTVYIIIYIRVYYIYVYYLYYICIIYIIYILYIYIYIIYIHKRGDQQGNNRVKLPTIKINKCKPFYAMHLSHTSR